MDERFTIKKVRLEDEDWFTIVTTSTGQIAGNPVLSTSNPLLKTEAMDQLRALGVSDKKIQSLIDQAESHPA